MLIFIFNYVLITQIFDTASGENVFEGVPSELAAAANKKDR